MFSRLNSHDTPYIVADFLEFKCLQTESTVSSLNYRSLLSISDDEIDNEGIESSDDLSVDKLDEAIGECFNRSEACPNSYPFVTGRSSLELKTEVDWHKDIYEFLLLTTRKNMQTQRVQAGYDGTELFEELCAEVVQEYYGCHAKCKVFGTAVDGSFDKKVKGLIKDLNLNATYRKPKGTTGHEKDGGLDIVAWIPFTDKKDAQLIALGQCKTGTNWEGMLTELEPSTFFDCYISPAPCLKTVVKMFFVAESFGNYKWEYRYRSGGILFDRTRIMDYLPNQLKDGLLDKIQAWNHSAMEEENKLEDMT